MASSWWSSKTAPAARPLRLWLALRIGLVGMLPLAVVAALVLVVLLPRLRADLEIQHQALARAIAGQIESHLLGAGRELHAIAEYLHYRSYQPASFWFGPLDAHAGTGDVFAAIYIADADDSVYAVGLPPAQRGQRGDLLGLDLSKRLFLREARERNADVWSETFLSTVSGRLAVTLAIPVAGQVLIGEIAIDRLSEFIGRLPAESGMLTMILDRQGQIIAHSQPGLSGQQLNLSHWSIVHNALRGRFATHGFELDGEMLIGTPVQVPRLDWIVLVAQPYAKAFQLLLSTLWALAAGALVALLLGIMAAWALARGFAQRIGRYAAQAHAIANGDYDQPWPISHIREFDSLAGDLGRMSLAIRQRERDLATSEARYRSVISNAPVVIFQFDEQGVVTLNEGKGLAPAGLAAGAGVGHSLFNLYHNYPRICEYACRAIAGESLQFITEIRNTFYDVFFNPVQDSDGHIQVMGMAVDITDRKRVEEELRRHREHLEDLVAERTAELRQAMDQLVQAEKLAALGSLVAGVAHELNTPLGNSRTVASALGDDLRVFAAAVESGTLRRSQVEDFLSRGREAVDLLERNTVRAADLIGHFKQVAVDQTSMRRRRFNLCQTIEEILVTLRPQLKHTAHQIVLDIPAELELDSYPGPLEQVIVNLVSNSLHHGFVGVETGCIQLQARAIGPTQVTLRYADTGVGIPPATLNRIFEPFFTTRLGQGGSGLGLYIVYTLVTGALGGRIEARSEPGKGAEFALELPLIAPQAAPLGEIPRNRSDSSLAGP